MRKLLMALPLMFFLTASLQAQEFFIYTEPASNIPAGAITVKLSGVHSPKDIVFDRTAQRLMPELGIGISKRFMAAFGTSFSNMHTFNFKYESFFVEARYRFLSKDEIHKHFRMAAYLKGSVTKAPFHFDEVSLNGDKTGLEMGLIATRLNNRFAFSASVSHTQLLDDSRFNKVVYIPQRTYQVNNYSLSAGYLLLPKAYKTYKQPNLNVYCELLAQQALDKSRYFIDVAPAIQLIIASSMKINLGYRMQVSGNAERMSPNSMMLGVEKTFLNALSKKRQISSRG